VSIVSDGESCTATAEAVGSSTITVTYVVDGITKKAQVTIVVSAANDGTQPDSYSTTYNSGTRGVTCNSLSGTYADEYYTGSYTYSALSQQTGSTLLSSLRSLTTSTHTTTSSYNSCRDNAYRTDCQEEDQTVVLLYTGYVADQDDFSGSAPGWNREHVWPQSLGGFGTSGAGADMHHIRPDDVTTNGDRGNKLFGNVSSGTESLASSLCNNMLGGWYDNSYFEPLDNVKGDVARICLYVHVRYGSTYSECADITNVFKDTATLLEWMAMDPVDTWEMGRNVVVEGIQGNRNPFIDYPELAWNLFGQEAPDGYATPSGSLLPCTHSYAYSINKGEHTATCSLCGDSKTEAHNYVNKVCECGAQTMSIYFQNNWLWTDVSLYYWYDGGSYDNAWPGKAMTWYGKNTDTNNPYDIYVMEVPTHATGVIINGIKDDGSGDRDQTPNIESGWYDGICYYMYWVEGSGNQVGSYNIGDATINTSAVSAAVLPYDLSNTAPVRSASTASTETQSSAPATRETTVEEGTASGLVFIDGNEAASLEEYEAHGPNNEIYLAKNQAVAFNLSFNTAPKTIQIGLKSVEGDETADKASWFVVSCGSKTRTFKITTATEMYYDITDLVTIGVTVEGNYASASPIIITKTNGDLGSLTYLKWTAVSANTVERASASTFLADEDLADVLDQVDEIVGNTQPNEEPLPPIDEDEGPILPPDEDEGPILPPDEGNDPTEPPIEDETPEDPTEPPVEDETPAVDVEKFTDLDQNTWYYEGVAYAVERGLMNGMSETQFMPDETLTRAMLVTILYRQAGSPAVGDAAPGFVDVTPGIWYYDAVAWAYEQGITTGVTATEFAPDLPVTRQQMVTFLWRAAGEPKAELGYGETAPADAAAVAPYAAEAMAWAYENQIIKGEDGLLKPEQNATRAQIANIFMRYEKALALASEM
ncbi:MAG: endonuclease, partial [Oscillospiraceae bacterium]|nr:endonuclease [Oscillospiraceae bacterium]